MAAKPEKPPEVRIRVDTGGKKKKPDAADKAAAKERADLFEHVSRLRTETRGGGAGHRVALFRFNDAAKEDDYLGPLPIEEFSLDRVREIFGGGKYRARIQNQSGQYLSQDGERFAFRIAGPSRHPDEKPATAAPTTPASVELALAEMRGWMAASKDRPAAGGVDIAALMGAMATAQSAAQANMVALFQLLKPAAGDGGGSSFEMLDRAFELVERFKGEGNGGGDPLMMAAFGGLAKSLERIADSQRSNGTAPAPRQLPAPAPAAADTSTTTSEGAVPGDSVTLTDLKPYMASLTKLAKAQKDPNLYAEVLLDQLTERPAVLAYLAACREPIARQRLEAQLLGAFPETAPFAEWFAECFAAIWDMLDNPEGDAGDLDGKPAAAPASRQPADGEVH